MDNLPRPWRFGATTAVALLLSSTAASAQTPDRVHIPGGSYEPFYPVEDDEIIDVGPFEIDTNPVTNAAYLTFVEAVPRWQRGRVPLVFADANYLSSWADETTLSAHSPPNAPVAFVSWFAAVAYCDWSGGTLPIEAQWELVGRADANAADGHENPAYVQSILNWYSRPRPDVPIDTGQSGQNFFGVRDMHALHWEWVLDYDASLVSGDNRQDGDSQSQFFCGGAAIGAADTSDYAAFMRYAYRGSLEATYTVHNLGFRCVAEDEQ